MLPGLLAGLPMAADASGSGGMPPLVFDIGLCFLLAGVLAIVFVRLHIPEIAAFLVAGALLGPFGLGLVTDPGSIDTIAQLGLILLLFMVGMELNIAKLMASGRTLIISGLLQYPLTVLFGVLAVKALVLLGVIAGIGDGGDYSLPHAFGWIAKRPEIVLVAAIAWCFVVVFAGSLLDALAGQFWELDYPLAVGASMAALIAGATIAKAPNSTARLSLPLSSPRC